LINEFLVSLTTVHILFFTDWVPDKQLQYTFGFSMIAVISIQMITNILIVLYFSLNSFRLFLVWIGNKMGCPWIKMKPEVRQLIADSEALFTFRAQNNEQPETPRFVSLKVNPFNYHVHIG
jgi:hypothetical protein